MIAQNKDVGLYFIHNLWPSSQGFHINYVILTFQMAIYVIPLIYYNNSTLVLTLTKKTLCTSPSEYPLIITLAVMTYAKKNLLMSSISTIIIINDITYLFKWNITNKTKQNQHAWHITTSFIKFVNGKKHFVTSYNTIDNSWNQI